MEKIAIIGAGLIGRGWAMVFARAGHEVALYDTDAQALKTNLAVIRGALKDLRAAGTVKEVPDRIYKRIRAAASLEDALAGADYAQENVSETLAAKKKIFAAMDTLARPGTILASSTSTIPASAFTKGLKGRSRCLVAHPVNPPHLVPLVELCPAPWTSQRVVARARAARVCRTGADHGEERNSRLYPQPFAGIRAERSAVAVRRRLCDRGRHRQDHTRRSGPALVLYGAV